MSVFSLSEEKLEDELAAAVALPLDTLIRERAGKEAER